MKTIFKERQKFTQWWLWTLLIGLGVLPIYGIHKQMILGEPFGNNPLPDWGLIIFSLFIFGLITLFIFLRLDTEIDENEIRINFYPFLRRNVSWKDVESAEVIKYNCLGGWGIRFSTKYGTVYNAKGNKGLEIKLTNGKKIVIGIQKENELSIVVEKLTPKNYNSNDNELN
jgi:hypothetical protein